MIITTTPHIDGKRITSYLGFVTGEAVIGANMFKDMFASIRDIVGGRSGSYEKELRKQGTWLYESLRNQPTILVRMPLLGLTSTMRSLGEKMAC